jgi:mevalonate kinase
MQIGNGKAGAKTILFGEHSVVYGYSSIAIPLKNFSTKVEITSSDEKQFIYNNRNIPQEILKIEFAGFYYLVDKLHKQFNFKNNFKIVIDSNIPSKSGLGSSASIAIAIIRAIYNFFDTKISNDELATLANEAEMINHTNASGVDAITIIEDSPIEFSKNEGFTKLRLNAKGYILLLDSGQPGSTSESVKKVKQLYEKDPNRITEIFENIEKNQTSAITADTDEFGDYLTTNQKLLKELGVSTPILDGIIADLIKQGATGSKLTGGGLGGSVIAFFKDKETALKTKRNLEDRYNIWISKL